eukprot:2181172-Amphidinium_carterae.2
MTVESKRLLPLARRGLKGNWLHGCMACYLPELSPFNRWIARKDVDMLVVAAEERSVEADALFVRQSFKASISCVRAALRSP